MGGCRVSLLGEPAIAWMPSQESGSCPTLLPPGGGQSAGGETLVSPDPSTASRRQRVTDTWALTTCCRLGGQAQAAVSGPERRALRVAPGGCTGPVSLGWLCVRGPSPPASGFRLPLPGGKSSQNQAGGAGTAAQGTRRLPHPGGGLSRRRADRAVPLGGQIGKNQADHLEFYFLI